MCETPRGLLIVPVSSAGWLLELVRWSAQPEAIRVPVQMHGGQEDSMKGLSDPEVRPAHGQTTTCIPHMLCAHDGKLVLLTGSN